MSRQDDYEWSGPLEQEGARIWLLLIGIVLAVLMFYYGQVAHSYAKSIIIAHQNKQEDIKKLKADMDLTLKDPKAIIYEHGESKIVFFWNEDREFRLNPMINIDEYKFERKEKE